MQIHKDILEVYRDAVMQVVHANNQSLLLEDRMSEKQKAGTALTMAAASVAFAAGMIAETDPRSINAPIDAQIDDALNLLRETLVRKGPDFKVVDDK